MIEKLESFKVGDKYDRLASYHKMDVQGRIGKPRGYRAPFTGLAITRDTFYAVTVSPAYEYEINRNVAELSQDLRFLIDKSDAYYGAYIQLIVNKDLTMRAKLRTSLRSYVFNYSVVTECWVQKELDLSKPWNW